MPFDVSTLILIQTLLSAVLTAAMAFSWKVGQRVPGTGAWTFGFGLVALGRFLIVFRGTLPDYISIIAANTIILSGFATVIAGCAEYEGKKISRRLLAAPMLAYVFAAFYFTYFLPSYRFRVLIFSLAAALSHLCVALIFRSEVREEHRSATGAAVIVNALYSILNLARGIAAAFDFVGTSIFEQNAATELYMLIDIIFIQLFAFNLFLIVNTTLRSQLIAAASAKDLLFKEMNHRTKNNLALVQSLISLAASSIEDEVSREAVDAVNGRIQTITMLHERLYRLDPGLSIKADEYLGAVASGAVIGAARMELDIEPLELENRTALSLALVLNELVTNSVKHAFKPGQLGTIRVSLKREGNECVLLVVDDGCGCSKPDGVPTDSRSGLGASIIEALSLQLRGKMSYDCRQGTKAWLRFPLECAERLA